MAASKPGAKLVIRFTWETSHSARLAEPSRSNSQCRGTRRFLPAPAQRLVQFYKIDELSQRGLRELLPGLNGLQLQGQNGDVGRKAVPICVKVDVQGALVRGDRGIE